MSAFRVILHVDMDAFFAAVEQREDPRLKGRPVIVGADPREGRGRGVVAACSYEARAFGIHSALPIGQAYRLCPEAVFVRPNSRLYGRISSQIMDVLRRFTDLVEQISVDEAFLDVTGSRRLFGEGIEIARTIKAQILAETRLTCSVGVAPNKFLAKIASDMKKPDGVLVVERGREREFLAPLPIRTMWGIGARAQRRFHTWGVYTIGDIASQECSAWARRLGKRGTHLWELSRGIDERPVQSRGAFKSLSHESTFRRDCRDRARIEKKLLALSEKVARRVRKHGLRAGTVHLKWRDSDFSTVTRQRRLSQPTDHGPALFQVVKDLAGEFFPLTRAVRLLGVGVAGFDQADGRAQATLFQSSQARSRALDQSVDRIADRFGVTKIGPARLLDRGPEEDDEFTSFLTN